MRKFTGREYLLIDVANQYGLDKLNWEDRISWTERNYQILEAEDGNAKHPVLYRKAVRALRRADRGEEINHIMGLDATASGLQVMAAASRCVAAAKNVNLINTGQRRSVYGAVANTMNKHGAPVDEATMKKPVMTTFYGSIAQPRNLLGEGTHALEMYYVTLEQELPGPYRLMQAIQRLWDPTVKYYQWRMPDGHTVRIPVLDTVDKRLEIDEFNNASCTYRTQVVKPVRNGRSLAANVVHSIDGMICRGMVKLAHEQGFQIATIHDCFYAHPNYMNHVRENYLQIMSWLSRKPVLESILRQFRAYKPNSFKPDDVDISQAILAASYALS